MEGEDHECSSVREHTLNLRVIAGHFIQEKKRLAFLIF